MLRCDNYIPLLSARLDEELSPEEARLLEEHLKQCPQCQQLWEQFLTLHTSFSCLEESAPEGFSHAVMARISPKNTQTPKIIPLFRRPQVQVLAGAAACALLCFALAQSSWKDASQSAILSGSGTLETASESESVLSVASEATDSAESTQMMSDFSRAIPEATVESPSFYLVEGGSSSPVEVISEEELEASSAPSYKYDVGYDVGAAHLILSQLPEERIDWLERRPYVTDSQGRAHYTLSLEEGTRLLALAEEQGLSAQWKSGSEETTTCILILDTASLPSLQENPPE